MRHSRAMLCGLPVYMEVHGIEDIGKSILKKEKSPDGRCSIRTF